MPLNEPPATLPGVVEVAHEHLEALQVPLEFLPLHQEVLALGSTRRPLAVAMGPYRIELPSLAPVTPLATMAAVFSWPGGGCCATWCLPCFMCKTANDSGQCVCLPLLDPTLTGYFLGFTPLTIPPISLAMRASLRERYGIQLISFCPRESEAVLRPVQSWFLLFAHSVLPGYQNCIGLSEFENLMLPISCCATWCLPCFMCKTANDFGQCVCLPLLDPTLTGYFFGFTPLTIPPISLAMRASLRERYGIQGTICDDCCTVFCCFSCNWCQMARELKKRKQPLTIVNAHTTTFNTVQPSQQPAYNPKY
ncbi:PL8L1 protein, partial [Polypterus senegalus]